MATTSDPNAAAAADRQDQLRVWRQFVSLGSQFLGDDQIRVGTDSIVANPANQFRIYDPGTDTEVVIGKPVVTNTATESTVASAVPVVLFGALILLAVYALK